MFCQKTFWFDVSEFQRSLLTQIFYFKDATGKLRPDGSDQAVAFLISPPKDVGHSTCQTYYLLTSGNYIFSNSRCERSVLKS